MKKILISAAAASMLALAAVPALAQPYGGYDGRWRDTPRYDQGIVRGDDLGARIDRAERRRLISYREADQLRADLRAAERQAMLLRREHKVSPIQLARVDRAFAHVERRLDILTRDRAEGYGRDYGYRR